MAITEPPISPDQLRKNLSSRLSELMEEYGGDYSSFASRCGVSERALRRWVNGSNTITVLQLLRISEATDSTMNWLIGRGEEDE